MAALNVRLPNSLKERVRAASEEEGISMNQYILMAVAEKTAVREAARQSGYLAARAALAKQRAEEEGITVREHFMQLMNQVPDVEPDPEDRLPEEMQGKGTS